MMLRGALTRALSSSFLSSKFGGKGGKGQTTRGPLPSFFSTGSVVVFRPFGGGSIDDDDDDDDDDDAFWNREGKKVVTGPTKKGQRLLFEKKKKKKTKDDDDDDSYYYGEREDVVDAFLVTGYGRDRPGIYAQFSRAALAIRADVESARLAKLGSDFTITALVSVAKKHNRTTTTKKTTKTTTTTKTTKKALEDALDAHIDRFTCDVREVPPETRRNEAHARSRGYKKLIIRATNFPGITSRVTETLAKCGLNIEALRMDTKMSPFNKTSARGGDVGGRGGVDGDEMYFCETTVRLIDGAFREETFKREVEKLEDELSCDVDVEDVSDVE